MSSSDTLRIVSYNVRYFGHALRGLASTLGPKRRVAAAIAQLKPLPDVICLQEVETTSLRSRVAHRGAVEGENQLQAFMGRMEEMFKEAGLFMPYVALYYPAHAYRVRTVNLYTTGLAVLVNTQRLTVDSHNSAAPMRITHHHVEAMREHKQTRICAHLRLRDARGRHLHIFNTHLSLPTPFAREFWSQRDKMGFGRNQLSEAKLLAGFVQKYSAGEPFIVCGDFNSAPFSPVFRYLCEEGSFASAQQRMGQLDPASPRRFPTAGFTRLRMHIDHLFYGGGLEWDDLSDTYPFGDERSHFHGLSDHMPLIGRFHLPAHAPIHSHGAAPA
ncbi:MAG: endonuclease/exonuclease/phosphatase family protein [Myxococcaceae bacterium]|nr:endonuclease/exonuclease/phosphatase family protein [Myxococcaceae bacterium]MCI0672043.1 endonuclease/exonuclease/phosphatase family protein [Myxococcaceae bacterium]